jgi:hypothetical protein
LYDVQEKPPMTGRYSLNRVVILAVPALLFMLGSAAFAPIFADSLVLTQVGGGGQGAGGCPVSQTVTSGAASISCTFDNTGTIFDNSVMGNLATGVFGAEASVDATLGSGGTPESIFQVTYDFAVSGVSNGTAQFDISANGILTSSPLGSATAEFNNLGGSAITVNGSAAPADTPLGSGLSNIIVTTNIVNGTTQLQFLLSVVATCCGQNPPQGQANADFLDPTSITGASVFDANGNLISGASLVSDSGFNPNAGTPIPAPEPSSLLLLGAGLLALIGTAKLKALTA